MMLVAPCSTVWWRRPHRLLVWCDVRRTNLYLHTLFERLWAGCWTLGCCFGVLIQHETSQMKRVFVRSPQKHANKQRAAALWWRGNLRDWNESKLHLLSFFPWTSSLCSSLLSGPGLCRNRENPLLLLRQQSSVSAGCRHMKHFTAAKSLKFKDQPPHPDITPTLYITSECSRADSLTVGVSADLNSWHIKHWTIKECEAAAHRSKLSCLAWHEFKWIINHYLFPPGTFTWPWGVWPKLYCMFQTLWMTEVLNWDCFGFVFPRRCFSASSWDNANDFPVV